MDRRAPRRSTVATLCTERKGRHRRRRLARLKTGEMRYMGFSEGKDVIPEVKQAKDWAALVEGWEKELDAWIGLRFG